MSDIVYFDPSEINIERFKQDRICSVSTVKLVDGYFAFPRGGALWKYAIAHGWQIVRRE